MSACTVGELLLAAVALVAIVFAFRYKQGADRMKTRARIYIRYVPSDQLTGQERIVFEELKRDFGLPVTGFTLISHRFSTHRRCGRSQ